MRTLIVGNYIDDNLKQKRGLPSSNPAGSNRMYNISSALSLNRKTSIILSAGSAGNIKFNSKLIHPYQIVKNDQNIIIFASALGIPYLSIIFEPFSVLYIFFKLFYKYKFKVIVLYCYYPSTVLIALFGKLLNLKIIEDLQDIVKPKISDILSFKILFALQQYLGYIFMKITLLISDIILVPTNKFKTYYFKNKYLKIDGCVNFNEIKKSNLFNSEINILYSGLINDENGRNLFLDTLSRLDNSLKNNLIFHVSGVIENDNHFLQRINTFTNLKVIVHGFLNIQDFKVLLDKINVCLVLQNPNGRNSWSKTPSKGFEYLSKGKVLICTNIGDFIEIPNDCILFLDNYDAITLEEKILMLPTLNLNHISHNAYVYAKDNWNYPIVQEKIFNKLLLN
jgi:hypothetical protein